LANGVTIEAGCKLADDVTIEAYCKLADDVTIGARCNLAYGVALGTRCKLADDVALGTRCKLADDVALGARCKLANGVTLGAGCKLADGVTWKSQPLLIYGTRHIVQMVSPTLLQIGCLILTIEQWREDGIIICQCERYTVEQIEEYGLYIELAAKLYPPAHEETDHSEELTNA
jgi:hypothetical protein